MEKKIAIQAALTRQLFTANKIAQVVSIILAALLVYIQFDVIDSEVVLAWGFMVVLVALLRTALAIAYQRSDISDNSATHSWLIRFRLGIFVSGMTWGSTSILLFPANNPQHQIFLVFILAGLTAGALISCSADLISAIVFIVSAILPLIIRLLVTEDSVSVAMSMALMLYLGFMIMSLRGINRNVSENVTLRLEATEREAFQRSLLDAIPIPVFYKDRDGRYLGFNNAYVTFFGATKDQLIGKTIFDISPQELAKIYDAKDIELIEGGGAQRYESQVRSAHGALRDVIFNKAVFADSRGAIGGLIGTILDITERKHAEKYEQFRSRTLELLSGGVPLQDLLEGIVRGVEQLKPDMICSILLLDSQGKRFDKGIGPSLPDFYNAAINGVEIGVGVCSCGTAAATGKRVIVDDIMTHPYWTPYKDLAARAGLAACWSEPILSSSGQVLGIFAAYHREVLSPTAFDISVIENSVHLASIAIERKRAEDALRASEQEFRTLAENLPDILVRYDREGRRTYVNPTLKQNFAVTDEQFMGKTLQEANPTNMPMMETYQRALEHTLATGERSEFELQATSPGGDMDTHLCFIAAERASNGQISGAIAISRDITKRKRYEAELERYHHHLEKLVEDRTHALSIAKEAAEAATRAKSHFLAAASHDMRQPLQSITLFNDALAMTALDEGQKRISHKLSKSVNSLSELLNKLLDLSRFDAGMIEPRPVVIQAEDLLGVIEAEFDGVSREKNLSLHFYCPLEGLVLFSDDNLLLTLLRNLVSNAVKYTKRGGILISIRRRGDRALIQVWDTGIGIAAEQMNSIFEEYYQIGNRERDRTKGVGLGLAIVRRLSKLLDVGVRVRSRIGKGSVFELSVPLVNESDEHASPLAASATLETIAPARLAGKSIVVIEDDAAAAEAIKLSLEIAGAHVTLFGTAEDALRSAETMAADHYISDYRLPGMDGLQMLDAIQTNSAEPIKAVLLTGNISPDQVAISQTSRWKVLFKPVDLPKLLSAMDM